jgi:hypothetical protein
MMFVFLPQCESAESVDVSERILERMTDRSNEHFEKANKQINEEMAADLKELKETFSEQSDKNKYIHAMTIALNISKDAEVNQEIILSYAEEILDIKTDRLDSWDDQLYVLFDVIKVERTHFKTEKEFVAERKKRVDQILSVWGKATAEVDESWRIGKKLSRPTQYKPPKEYTEKEVFYLGIDASLIKDETVRRDYNAYLEKRSKIFAEERLQDTLHSRFWSNKDFLTNYLVTLYTTPPYAAEELSDMLQKYKIRSSFADELLKRVNQTIKEKR